MAQEKSKFTLKMLCFCAMFAALSCVATLISIPLPFGYFNLGDTVVIVCAWCLGAPGIIAAALGSALADLILGFAIYAPATAVIKGLMALVAWLLCKKLHNRSHLVEFSIRPAVAVLCEAIMVAGYLFYEAVILGYGAGAFASILGNCLQGLAGVVGSVLLFAALKASSAIRIFQNHK
jgi:uncharacterized membrane protein